MSTPTENTYISFIENSHKNNCSYICFLQYNGNEEELNKLYTYITAQEGYEGNGDMSEFIMDINTIYSEQTVNDTLKLKGMNHTKFYKCTGNFICPITQPIVYENNYEDDNIYIDDLYELINENFYGCSIIYMF